jgi:ankyrin repeat protein
LYGGRPWRSVSPLMVAAGFGHVEVVQVLLHAGARVNQAGICTHTLMHSYYTRSLQLHACS